MFSRDKMSNIQYPIAKINDEVFYEVEYEI